MRAKAVTDDFESLIMANTSRFRLDQDLVRAICFVESSFDPSATRFEPAWSYFINVTDYAHALEIDRTVEEKNQATSWGLMQVMGSVARELGFADRLEGLLIPELGLFYGCKKLAALARRKSCNGEEESIIASYNAGGVRRTPGGLFVNQRYVDRVCQRLRELRALI